MTDSEVFVISAARLANPLEAVGRAAEVAGLGLGRVQEVIFGVDESIPADAADMAGRAGLSCPAAVVAPGLRAVSFAAQSILSGDADLVLVVDAEEAAALLLASPAAVGRHNLSPRARLAARSLSGPEASLGAAGLTADELSLSLEGQRGVSLVAQAIERLEQGNLQWGLVTQGTIAVVIERI